MGPKQARKTEAGSTARPDTVSQGEQLFTAAQNGDTALCVTLLDAGADVNHLHKVQNSFPMFRDPETIRMLGEPANARDSGTPLFAAARCGHLETCELLISRGADVNIADPRESATTSLAAAASKGHDEVCRLLLENGAHVTGNPGHESTPMEEAIQAGQIEICRLLIESGFDVQRFDSGGQTPLHAVAYRGDTGICKLLIAHGAHTVLDKKEQVFLETPLCIAASNGHVETCRILIKCGADMEAARDHNPALEQEMGRSFAYGRTPLLSAMGRGKGEALSALASHGASIHCADSEGYSPLSLLVNHHVAVHHLLFKWCTNVVESVLV